MATVAANDQPAPNFVVIVTDDQGPWALPSRMPELHMPNLASLIERGCEVTNAYCASPVCSPSRASMLTGMLPSAHGIHDWLTGEGHPDSFPDTYLDNLPTTPELLAEAGYTCAMIGKWHMGNSRYPAPGFSTWYAHRRGGGPYWDAPIWREEHAASEPDYFTTAVGDRAVDFISEQAAAGVPFFCWMAMTAPHDPWFDQHPDRYLDLYAQTDFPSVPREELHPWFEARKEDFHEALADPTGALSGYCASLSAVDEQLGRVLDALAVTGVEDNTYVIYLSDNGFSCGHHGIWGKGNGTDPLNLWRNSVGVPFVICGPTVSPESPIESPWSTTGLHPTICDLAGIAPPEDPRMVGRSLREALAGDESDLIDAPVAVHSEYGGARLLRRGDYTYIHRSNGPDELYNAVLDPEERVNLAADPAYQDIVSDLHRQLEEFFAAAEDPGRTAFDRAVTGRGQVHPLWRGYNDSYTYVQP